MATFDPAWLQWEETQALVRGLGKDQVRFVGGCVRDALLRRPVQDVDAATPLLPQAAMEHLRKAGIKAIPTGIAHGTVTAIAGRRSFEITTLRCDVATDGRHATVAFTDDWQQDASRRDFTLNALYCDPDGRLYDYFGGAGDAKIGRVRFIGDAETRIREDGLRILRFFRFFAQFGRGEADAEGLAACGRLAELLDRLSGERIAGEMFKLFAAPRAADALGLMEERGVLSHVLLHAGEERLGALRRLTGNDSDSVLALALLLRGREERALDALADRWKLSNARRERLRTLVHTRDATTDADMKKQMRALGKEAFADIARLRRAEVGSDAAARRALALAEEWAIPSFPVTGADLLARGVKSGREMGALLKRLEDEWEAGGYQADKAALLRSLG